MIDPLPEIQREFLVVMGLADEFSAEMAKFITENEDTKQLLSAMTKQNAFVSRLTRRSDLPFHHMMKECAERAFMAMDKEKPDNLSGPLWQMVSKNISSICMHWTLTGKAEILMQPSE